MQNGAKLGCFMQENFPVVKLRQLKRQLQRLDKFSEQSRRTSLQEIYREKADTAPTCHK